MIRGTVTGNGKLKSNLSIRTGIDGVSPVVSVESIDGGNKVTITDAAGAKSFEVMDGVDGKDGTNGTNGKDGTSAYDYAVAGGYSGSEQQFLQQLAGVGNVTNNAPAHNAIFRGEDLTNKYTIDQICERISNGTFEDLYIGDYFDIPFEGDTMRCILAAFDYYYQPLGGMGTRAHHALIVPKNAIAQWCMTYDMSKGFVGSEAFTSSLPSFSTTLQNVFGDYLLPHTNYFSSAVNTDGASSAGAGMMGYASSHTMAETYLSLLSEIQVYGTQIWSSSPYNSGLDKSQLPLFAFDESAKMIGCGGTADGGSSFMMYESYIRWWLRDIASASEYSVVDTDGTPNFLSASMEIGTFFRPFFLIGDSFAPTE